MEIKKKIVVPTGEIYTAIGEKGMLEFLTVGDYGKNANIKADFLGITRDLNGVPNGETMPLTEKWVITISTQYGCSMGCKFCDVPKVGIGRNATFNDLKGEVLTAIKQHPEVKHTKRLNIHYARMGEPTWNANVLLHAISIKKDIEPFIGDSLVHPVISTMLPKKNKKLVEFLHKWCYIKNEFYKGVMPDFNSPSIQRMMKKEIICFRVVRFHLVKYQKLESRCLCLLAGNMP